MGGNTAVTLNSVASFSFSSIETFEWDSLTFSCEDEGPAVAILFKSLLCTSGTITQLTRCRYQEILLQSYILEF